MFKYFKRKGFTLIELIVIMAILGILVFLGSPKYLEYTKDARQTKLTVEAKELEKASQKYYMRNNDWPRLSDEPYTSDEVVAFSERVLDSTGKVVELDSEGNYYDIDYSKLSNYMTKPTNPENYVLQNPVGSVYSLDKPTPEAVNRIIEGLRVPVESVTLNKVSSTIFTGETLQLIANVQPEEATNKTIEWVSSNTSVATVDTNGIVIGKSIGNTVITAKTLDGDFTATSNITVIVPFTTATFTNAGKTGNTGPSQAQLNSAYNGTILQGKVTSSNGIQSWTVPKSGTYRIEAIGARGGNSNNGSLRGGYGAIIAGDFNLEKGEVIHILVGQAGGDTSNGNTGGGGGTFVYKDRLSHNPLIAAGGGGGSLSASSDYTNNNGVGINASATATVLNKAGGSTSGQVNIAGEGAGWGGAGWRTNATGGTSSAGNSPYAYSPRNGGQGYNSGGFGGGHSTNWTSNGGAGGGYTGGIGAYNVNGARGSGGGSYNSGTNQSNTVGNTGHGKVVITYIGE